MKKLYWNGIDVWGGIECSLNRVGDTYMDQLERSGHYTRINDLEKIAAIGVRKLRYPILWEKYQPVDGVSPDFGIADMQLKNMQELAIDPIIGLVHHGSGPRYVSFFDDTFAEGLAKYAATVASQYPWVKYFTPVNEPLTTARFCGLYGIWYPHGKNDFDFLKILLAECKGTVLAMQEIRKVNPKAKLVQTEDMGMIHSTPMLRYQADFENHRRWLSFDLLCGRVTEEHPLWQFIIGCGITHEELAFFTTNPCPPDIIGINHYITSERWLDERTEHYPPHTIGGNGRHTYADVEAVRVNDAVVAGPENLLLQTYERYQLPIAITEVHLHCTREEQLRWFHYVWNCALNAKNQGADIIAVTAWAILGSYDWCSLLTRSDGIYEPGLFDVESAEIRPTALTRMVKTLAHGQEFHHPVLDECGWWNRDCRIQYCAPQHKPVPRQTSMATTKPLLIIGKTGTLGKAFSRVCLTRAIHHVSLGREDVNILDEQDLERVIRQYDPWTVVNTAGFVRVDDAEDDAENCYLVNSVAPEKMARVCKKAGVHFVTFSSDLVFDGKKNNPYLESDSVAPINVYGASKAMAEERVMQANSSSLIVRTSAFFGPWDEYNFVYFVLDSLKNKRPITLAEDVKISPTYVPDLVHTTLDLLIDEANGIWNISNSGEISWYLLAKEVAQIGGYSPALFQPLPVTEMGWKASRPNYSVLTTERGFKLPSLDNALDRFFAEQEVLSF